jgi:hypothetical protein
LLVPHSGSFYLGRHPLFCFLHPRCSPPLSRHS